MIRIAVRKLRHVLGRRRDPRLALLKQLPRSAVCAEIGVWKGDFSMQIRRVTSPKQLHLIDPWAFQGEFPERRYGGAVARNQADMDRIYEDVRKKFMDCPDVILHRGKSQDVLPRFADAFFDWVYIDGNHYYEYVMQDLRFCRSKVMPGGIIAGDDYAWEKHGDSPVKRAVHDFVGQHDLESRLTVLGSQYLIRV